MASESTKFYIGYLEIHALSMTPERELEYYRATLASHGVVPPEDIEILRSYLYKRIKMLERMLKTQ